MAFLDLIKQASFVRFLVAEFKAEFGRYRLFFVRVIYSFINYAKISGLFTLFGFPVFKLKTGQVIPLKLKRAKKFDLPQLGFEPQTKHFFCRNLYVAFWHT